MLAARMNESSLETSTLQLRAQGLKIRQTRGGLICNLPNAPAPDEVVEKGRVFVALPEGAEKVVMNLWEGLNLSQREAVLWCGVTGAPLKPLMRKPGLPLSAMFAVFGSAVRVVARQKTYGIVIEIYQFDAGLVEHEGDKVATIAAKFMWAGYSHLPLPEKLSQFAAVADAAVAKLTSESLGVSFAK